MHVTCVYIMDITDLYSCISLAPLLIYIIDVGNSGFRSYLKSQYKTCMLPINHSTQSKDMRAHVM